MKSVSLVTGGGGGMGLATARLLGREHHVVLCDLDQQKLDRAAAELHELGIGCSNIVLDITDASAVDAAFDAAAAMGRLVSVIHAAAISPQMAAAKAILRVNALGTVNVTNASYRLAQEGFALVNVASMAGHLIPSIMAPTRAYPLALTDGEAFLRRASFMSRLMPSELYRNGLAYSVSKHFVMWLCRTSAAKFGAKGARILSVSPGTFDTDMGRLEEKSGSVEMLKTAALKRLGRPAEIAEVLAFCASDKAGYLTGTDILCDGGVIAGRA